MHIRAVVNPVDWESDFFGRRIGRLSFVRSDLLTFRHCDEWDLVQARVSSSDYLAIDQLGHLGFSLVEGEAELVIAVESTERQRGIKIARVAQTEALRELAGLSFSDSRFRTPWFSLNENQRFYRQWVENAVHGAFDDQCLLASEPDGQLAGFITLRQTAEGARVGLLAVAPGMQRKGIGQRLLLAAADWGRARSLNRLLINTQLSNLPALRLYLRSGARLENTAYWFYRKTYDSL